MFKTIPIIVLATLCLNFNSRAQSPQTLPLPEKQAILGKIISATTGEALPGAIIKVTNTNHTTVSDDKGEFILTLSNGTYNLSVSHIGYKTKNLSIQIPLKEQLVIALETDDLPNKTKKEQLVHSKTIQPLKIDDIIPEKVWNTPLQVVNHPEGKHTITLNDYKGKLIILDFWTTWCGSCIEALPKLQKLQSQFSDQIQFFPITFQDSHSINLFLNKNKIARALDLPIVTSDTLLSKFFPFKSISHIVWIDKYGVLRATTWSESINSETINQVLSGAKLDWNMKCDVMSFNKSISLLTFSNNGASPPQYIYHSMFSSHLNGLESNSAITRDGVAATSRIRLINFDVLSLCLRALNKPLPSLNSKLIFFEGNSRRYRRPENVKEREWSLYNTFCYEAVMPFSYPKEQFMKLLNEDLKRYLKIEGRLENRILNCLVLNPENSSQNERVNKNSQVTLNDFVWYLNERSPSIPFAIIESTSDFRMAPFGAEVFKNQESILKYLSENGVMGTFQNKDLEVFVIRQTI